MSFNFSQTAGTSGITSITVSATSREELSYIVENFTLSNDTVSVLMPVAQKAYAPLEKYIIFQPNSMSVESSGGTSSLNIQSNDAWEIVSDDWIQLSRYETESKGGYNSLIGDWNTIIGIRCAENTGNTRIGGISGYCKSDSAISATTTVQQSGSYVKPYLALGQYQYNIESSGQSGCSLAVVSNVDWTVTTDARWITLNTISGSNNGNISFDVQENEQTIGKRGTITVSSTTESISADCRIDQSASAVTEPYIIITPTTQNIPLSGGSFTISVSSNTDWNVTAITESQMVRPWISVDKLNGYGDDEVVVTIGAVGASEEIASRSGYISFYNNTQGIKTECDITQEDIAPTVLSYMTIYNTKLNPNVTTGWGANIISNTYSTTGLYPEYGKITFDAPINQIPNDAFNNYDGHTNLYSINIPKEVEHIGNNAFKECYRLRTVWFDTGRTSTLSVGNSAFINVGTSANNVTVNNMNLITTYDEYSFAICNLERITIGDNVTSIPNYCFSTCKKAQEVTIGSSVSEIGDMAFLSLQICTLINAKPTVCPTLGRRVFDYLPSRGSLHYPQGSDYSAFISALPSGWTAIGDL